MPVDDIFGQSWRELPKGGLIRDAGNSGEYETGDWRSQRPVWVPERCIHCLICWQVCPDIAIRVSEGRFVEFDYAHCKGCGMCARECPAKGKAIVMESEAASSE